MFLLEFALVWGAPITILAVFLFLLGLLVDLIVKRQFDGFFLLTIYLTLIYLKSGSVVSGGLFLVSFMCYASRGILVLNGIGRKVEKMQLNKRVSPS